MFNHIKLKGIVLDDKLSWEGHVQHIYKKLASAKYAINTTKNCLPLKIKITFYLSLFDSHINFGNLLCVRMLPYISLKLTQNLFIKNHLF